MNLPGASRTHSNCGWSIWGSYPRARYKEIKPSVRTRVQSLSFGGSRLQRTCVEMWIITVCPPVVSGGGSSTEKFGPFNKQPAAVRQHMRLPFNVFIYISFGLKEEKKRSVSFEVPPFLGPVDCGRFAVNLFCRIESINLRHYAPFYFQIPCSWWAFFKMLKFLQNAALAETARRIEFLQKFSLNPS